jgi:enoyl-CoA hydratase/carnithine racemase
MMQELYDALVEADRAEGIQAILITGVGKAFSAGADVKELMEGDFEQGLRWLKAYWRIIELIRETGKPVIAAVKGACVAGGHEIAMACDMAVAGESARLGQPEILVGSTAMGIGLQLLPLMVGERRAREMLFTGRLVSAKEAHSFGLVNRVVEDAKLEEETKQLAVEILDNASPQAFRVMKSGLKFWTDFAMLNMMMSRDVTSMVWASPEFKERSKDFLRKKKMKPGRFTGTMP